MSRRYRSLRDACGFGRYSASSASRGDISSGLRAASTGDPSLSAGTMTGAATTLNAAWVIVPLIQIAECFSWHAVLTRNYLCHAIENSIWGLVFFHGAVRVALVIAIIGIAGYLAFLATIDVPMYLTRWRAELANGSGPLSPLKGLRDASVRWVVTHNISEWKDEIAWMSLYFSAAVWASLALCVFCSLRGYLPLFVPTRRSRAGSELGRSSAPVRRQPVFIWMSARHATVRGVQLPATGE
jgi:hypothetical protein